MVLSIENGFLKIQNSIFRPKRMRDTKKLLKARDDNVRAKWADFFLYINIVFKIYFYKKKIV